MKFLTKWDTEAAYDAAKDNLATPQVAVVTETNTVNYKPYVDPYVGHDYVDLGLPSGTKWATMNVGASSEADYGNYYMYGKGADDYSVTSGQSDYSGTENPLASSADTASVVWGGRWHMPTRTQYQELLDNTTLESATINDTVGIKFIAQNGNYLFMPFAGAYDNGTLSGVNMYGLYSGSTPLSSGVQSAGLNIYLARADMREAGYNRGLSVRPVLDE